MGPETPDGLGVAVSALDAGYAVAADTVDRLHSAGRLDDGTAAAAHDAIESATDDLLETATTRPLIELPASVFADVAPPSGVVPADLVHRTDDAAYTLTSGVRRVRYRRGRDRETPVPDGPMRVAVDMWDVHHRVPAGDCLRLEVASSDAPRFDPHPGTTRPWEATDEAVCTAEQTLFHELDRESTLTVTHRRASQPPTISI